MKRKLSVCLAILMAGVLVACGSGGNTAPAQGNDATEDAAAEGEAVESADGAETAGEAAAASGDYAPIFSVSDLDMVNGMLMPSDVESRAQYDKGLPSEQKSDLKIGLSIATLSNPYFTAIINAAQEAADGYGYELVVMNAETDGDQMIANVEAFLAQGCDAIILDPVDTRAAKNLAEECVAQGVPVVGIGGALSADTPTLTSILANNYLNGWEAGLVAGKQFEDAGSIKAVAIIGKAGFANSKSRINGEMAGMIYHILNHRGETISVNDARMIAYNYADELFSSGKTTVNEINMTIGGYGQGEWTDEGGLRAMEDLLAANPDVELVLGENDWMAMGAVKAVEAAGKVAGQDVYFIAAADGSVEAMDMVKEGKLLCTGYNPPDMLGQCSVDLIHMIFEEGYDASNMPAATSLKSAAITLDNMDEYYSSPSGYAKVYDIEWQTIDDLAATADFN